MSPIRWLYISAFALLLVLSACDPNAPLPFLPTPTPTLIPTPTSTRTDELVIPFQTLAINDIGPLQPDTPGGKPFVVMENGKPTKGDPNALLGLEPTVFLVNGVGDLAPLEERLPPEILKLLADVNYSQDFVLVYAFPLLDTPAHTFVQRVATSQNAGLTGALTVYSVYYIYNYGLAAEAFPSQSIKISREDVPFPIAQDTKITLAVSKSNR